MKQLTFILLACMSISVAGQEIIDKYLGSTLPDTTFLEEAYGKLFTVQLATWNDSLVCDVLMYPSDSSRNPVYVHLGFIDELTTTIQSITNKEFKIDSFAHSNEVFRSLRLVSEHNGTHRINITDIDRNNYEYIEFYYHVSPLIDPLTLTRISTLPNGDWYHLE